MVESARLAMFRVSTRGAVFKRTLSSLTSSWSLHHFFTIRIQFARMKNFRYLDFPELNRRRVFFSFGFSLEKYFDSGTFFVLAQVFFFCVRNFLHFYLRNLRAKRILEPMSFWEPKSALNSFFAVFSPKSCQVSYKLSR